MKIALTSEKGVNNLIKEFPELLESSMEKIFNTYNAVMDEVIEVIAKKTPIGKDMTESGGNAIEAFSLTIVGSFYTSIIKKMVEASYSHPFRTIEEVKTILHSVNFQTCEGVRKIIDETQTFIDFESFKH